MNYIKYDFENKICEAIDCNAKAVRTVEVNAGTYGPMKIFLCKNCIDKFKERK